MIWASCSIWLTIIGVWLGLAGVLGIILVAVGLLRWPRFCKHNEAVMYVPDTNAIICMGCGARVADAKKGP